MKGDEGSLLIKKALALLNRNPGKRDVEAAATLLERALPLIDWPPCSLCGTRPQRGGEGQGAALCESCYRAE